MAFTGTIGHLEGVESPFSNAGGVVKTPEDVEVMARTGVGYVEAGSFTVEPRLGNAVDPEHPELGEQFKVYDHNPESGYTHNSLGMPNKGVDWLSGVLPEMLDVAHGHGKPLMVNVAPVSGEPGLELYDIVGRLLYQEVDGVIINGGCPNVKDNDGDNHAILSQDPTGSTEVAEMLSVYRHEFPGKLWYRVSPQSSPDKLLEVALGVISSKAYSAVLTPNTWPVDIPRDEDGKKLIEVDLGKCGQSGPATFGAALGQAYLWSEALKGSGVDVIQSAGIVNAGALEHALTAGAVAAAGTTFFYESQNGWRQDVGRMLTDLAS